MQDTKIVFVASKVGELMKAGKKEEAMKLKDNLKQKNKEIDQKIKEQEQLATHSAAERDELVCSNKYIYMNQRRIKMRCSYIKLATTSTIPFPLVMTKTNSTKSKGPGVWRTSVVDQKTTSRRTPAEEKMGHFCTTMNCCLESMDSSRKG